MTTANSKPSLTFAIPFYSTPEYLRLAIDSVRNQTRSDWSLVIVDDCSPAPGIANLVASYNDPRIKYAKNEKNLGQAGNWNRCLEFAESDLLTLLHADDQLLPTYMETMLNAANKWPDATAFFCRAKIIDGQGHEIFSTADFYKKFLVPTNTKPFELVGSDGLQMLLKGNFIMCPTLCYRLSKLQDAKFNSDWKCVLDMEYTTRLIVNGGKLVGLPDLAFAYRRHEDSGTANTIKNLTQFHEELKLYAKLGEQASKLAWPKAAKEAEKGRIIQLRLGFFAAKDLANFRFGNALGKLKLLTQTI